MGGNNSTLNTKLLNNLNHQHTEDEQRRSQIKEEAFSRANWILSQLTIQPWSIITKLQNDQDFSFPSYFPSPFTSLHTKVPFTSLHTKVAHYLPTNFLK